MWNGNPHKKCHKDIDTRWTVKRRKTEYGYTKHAKVRARTEMALPYDTTSANVAMTSLVYNVFRFCQILRYHGDWLVATY